MKKPAAIALAILFCMTGLFGCGGMPAAGNAATDGAPSGSPQATATPPPGPAATGASPSALPTPSPTPQGVLPEEDYALFGRVGFSADNGGAPAIGKWAQNLRIEVAGNPGAGDIKALGGFVEKLKGVAGIPDAAFVTEGGNVVIAYLPLGKAGETNASFNGSDTAQASVRWDGFAPVSASLFIADELAGQDVRDAALAGLMLRALGLSPDAGDAGAPPPDAYWLMLALLYSPGVEPGMPEAGVMPVVRALDPWMGGRSANNPALGSDETLAYFNEVGFWWASDSGDGIASKWATPVKLQAVGIPSMDEMTLLNDYIGRLNGIAGFPGIALVQSGGNFVISYQPFDAIKKAFPGIAQGEACRMKLTQKGGKITQCRIGVSTDFRDLDAARTQFLRLFMKALGFAYTSEAWPDSILNYSADARDWALLDWKMVGLLYRQDVKPGAKRATVMKMLRK